MILNDYFCSDHGEFEASHPICPAMGCDSHEVIKVYRKAPAYHDGATKRTDAGLRKTAESFGLSNLNSAREGETARPAMKSPMKVLWGDEAGAIGVTIAGAMSQPPAVFNVKGDDGQVRQVVDKGGMHIVGPAIEKHSKPGQPLPPAEITKMFKDPKVA